MLIFRRKIEENIRNWLFKGKLIVLYGPRQAGKTTLSKKIIKEYNNEGAYYDCQLADVRSHFVVGKPAELLPLVQDKKVVVFDEAQTIENIGTILKVFHDTYPGVQIIATGSSSFDLANKIVEPMTGRAVEFQLLPLSLDEVRQVKKVTREDLYTMMLYGMYPAVVGAETQLEKETFIKNISTNYLYKDVFVFEAIRKPKIFEDLVKLLAHQIGQLVSINELSLSLGVSRSVILRYIRLLEQAFIIKVIYSFSTSPRKELKKAFKVFFLDDGVRNSLVDITSTLSERNDKGSIFENFFITEKLKEHTLQTFSPELMFWRTRTGFEVDVIEKKGPSIKAYECKWSDTDVVFTQFKKQYPQASVEVVTSESLLK